ncbi:20643_t:CDS:2 [Funneliformis geosporum]|nr:20643_t:CDS:2 [Funneliformis geosporum]
MVSKRYQRVREIEKIYNLCKGLVEATCLAWDRKLNTLLEVSDS